MLSILLHWQLLLPFEKVGINLIVLLREYSVDDRLAIDKATFQIVTSVEYVHLRLLSSRVERIGLLHVGRIGWTLVRSHLVCLGFEYPVKDLETIWCSLSARLLASTSRLLGSFGISCVGYYFQGCKRKRRFLSAGPV